jgi:hypothetical protein
MWSILLLRKITLYQICACFFMFLYVDKWTLTIAWLYLALILQCYYTMMHILLYDLTFVTHLSTIIVMHCCFESLWDHLNKLTISISRWMGNASVRTYYKMDICCYIMHYNMYNVTSSIPIGCLTLYG